MPVYVALLRGVNVGKAKRVPMVVLRELLVELGYTDVATLLNSGNAVFKAARSTPARRAGEIADAIRRRLQFDVPVVVKSAAELNAIVAGNPLDFTDADHSRLLVVFAPDARTLSNLAAIGPLVVPPEQFAVGQHAAYLFCAAGVLESKAVTALPGKSGAGVTTRNWATVLKLQALAEPGSPVR